MNGNRLRPAVIVLLGVLAISAAAATMDGPAVESTAESGADESGKAGDGTGSTSGATYQGGPVSIYTTPGWSISGPVVQWSIMLVLGLGTAFLLGYVIYVILRDGLDGLLSVLKLGATTVPGVVIVFGGLLAVLLLLAGELPWQAVDIPTPGGTSGGGGPAQTTPPTGTTVPPLVLAVVGLALVGVVVFLIGSRLSSDSSSEFDSTTDATERERERAPSVRGPTRTSIEDVPPSNGVYRAWREMATSVDRDTLRIETPAEVARRAIDEGFDRRAVHALTETFEEVRYGEQLPTEDRVSRAESALNRLDRDGGEAA